MIAARIRHGEAWSDASILNISSRGLMLHAVMAPSRGTYIEIRRGQHIVVARVVWSNKNRIGVAVQGLLAIDATIRDLPPKKGPANDTEGFAERRYEPRVQQLQWRHVRSREKGRFMEFAFIASAGVLVAMLATETLGRALAQPLERITVSLSG